MRVLAGLDLGTTGLRCVLFDESLNTIGEDYREYPLITAESGLAEQDAELWWALTGNAIRGAIARAGCSACDIRALGISSQGITVLPVDSAFRPLANAISWLDRRPGTGMEEILAALGEQRFAELTARISPDNYGIAKAMWFERHRPELGAYKYLMPMDFLIARFCGRAVTDHSMAAGMACYDMRARMWSAPILNAAGIPEAMLAKIQKSGSIAGRITQEAARECGLEPGTIIAVGAQDQKCGALGAGISGEIATVSLGTCMALLVKSNRVVCDPNAYLPCFSDLFEEGYLLEGCVNVGAGCLKWYRDLFYPAWSYAQVTELAGTHEPTMETPMFYPHLSGMGTPHRWENCSGSFYGLTLATTPGGMAHSVLEAIAFALRQNLEAAKESAGADPKTLRVFSGGAQSEEWLQMIADVTGLRVESLYTHETCCVGAAMLAGLAAGVYSDTRAAQESCVRVKRAYSQNPMRKAVYENRYALYCQRERRIYKGETKAERHGF